MTIEKLLNNLTQNAQDVMNNRTFKRVATTTTEKAKTIFILVLEGQHPTYLLAYRLDLDYLTEAHPIGINHRCKARDLKAFEKASESAE